MTGPRVPEDRYGSRARKRSRPWVYRTLGLLTVLVCALAAVVAYNNLGSPPIQGKQTAFQVVDEGSVRITLEVHRETPQRTAECVVRARAVSGREVGRKEVLVPPAEGTVRQDTVLRTSARATIGEVYGCTYNVPEYLSNPKRPIG